MTRDMTSYLEIPVAGVPGASEPGGNTRAVGDVADEVVAGPEGHGIAVSQHPPDGESPLQSISFYSKST